MDPVTFFGITGSLITKIFSDKGLEAATTSVIGSRIDSFMGKLLETTWKKIKMSMDGNGIPRNQDLLRALRNSKMEATLIFVKFSLKRLETLAQFDAIYELDLNEMRKFEKAFLKWYSEELLEIKKLAELKILDSSYSKIELLLSSVEGKDVNNFKQILNKESKNEMIKDIQSGVYINELPQFFLKIFYEGFADEDVKIDWFELVILNFSEILKSDKGKRASEAFHNQILSDIKITISDTVTKLEQLIEGLDHIRILRTNLKELVDITEALRLYLKDEMQEKNLQIKGLIKVAATAQKELDLLRTEKDKLIEQKESEINELKKSTSDTEKETIERLETECKILTKQRRDLEKEIYENERLTTSEISAKKEEIEQLKLKLKTHEDNQEQLSGLKSSFSADEIEKIIKSDNVEKLENFLNERSFTSALEESSYRFLLIAIVALAKFDIETAEANFKKSISIFESEENLFRYVRFLFNKKDYNNCIEYSERLLARLQDGDRKVALVNIILLIFLYWDENIKAINVYNKFQAGRNNIAPDTTDLCNINLLASAHFLENQDNNLAKDLLIKTAESAVLLEDSRDKTMLLCRIGVLTGDCFFDFTNLPTEYYLENSESYKIALEHYEGVITLMEKLPGDDQEAFIFLGRVYARIGMVYRRVKNFELSGRYFSKASLILSHQVSIEEVYLEFLFVSFYFYLDTKEQDKILADFNLVMLYSSSLYLKAQTELRSLQKIFLIQRIFFQINFSPSRPIAVKYFFKEADEAFEVIADRSCNFVIIKGCQQYRVGASLFKEMGLKEQAKFAYQKAIHWLAKIFANKPIENSEYYTSTCLDFANYHLNQNENNEAEKMFDLAERISLSTLINVPSQVRKKIEIAIGKSTVHFRKGQKEEANKQLQLALQSIELYPFDDKIESQVQMSHLLEMIGTSYVQRDLAEEALDLYFKASNILAKCFETPNDNLAITYEILNSYSTQLTYIAKIFLQKGVIKEGLDFYVRGLEIKKGFIQDQTTKEFYVADYCRESFDLITELIKYRDKRYKPFLDEVLLLTEEHNHNTNYPWAEKLFQKAVYIQFLVATEIFPDDYKGTRPSPEVEYEQFITSLESLSVSMPWAIFSKDYNTVINHLSTALEHFEKYLSEAGRIHNSLLYFRLSGMLTQAFIRSKLFAEALNYTVKADVFAKEIVEKKNELPPPFLGIVKDYKEIYKELLNKSNFFNKSALKSSVKHTFKELKTTLSKVKLNPEDTKLCWDALDDFFALI